MLSGSPFVQNGHIQLKLQINYCPHLQYNQVKKARLCNLRRKSKCGRHQLSRNTRQMPAFRDLPPDRCIASRMKIPSSSLISTTSYLTSSLRHPRICSMYPLCEKVTLGFHALGKLSPATLAARVSAKCASITKFLIGQWYAVTVV